MNTDAIASGGGCKSCPACGQTLPDDTPFGIKFRGIRLRLVERVRRAGRHGVRADMLFDFLYGDDPNGGPSSVNVIAVHVSQINKRLRKVGKEIRGGHTGHGVFANYVLKDIA